jgi:hypothetical protein
VGLFTRAQQRIIELEEGKSSLNNHQKSSSELTQIIRIRNSNHRERRTKSASESEDLNPKMATAAEAVTERLYTKMTIS